MDIEVLRPTELGEPDREAWRRLQLADRDTSGPYFTLGWAEAVSQAREDARVAVLRRNGRAVGFLPFQFSSRYALLPLGGALSDYQGLIAAPGEEVDVAEVVRRIGSGRFDFNNLLGTQAAFARHHRSRHVSWVMDIEDGFEGYRERRRAAGSSVLKRIRGKRRKIERDVGPLTFTAFSKDEDAFAQLVAWKREQFARTGRPDVFAEDWAREVVASSFTQPRADFGGALFTLHAGPRLVAANYCLTSRDVLHCWFIAHDCAVSQHSPGLVLFGDMLSALDGAGYRELDLGGGEYRFKQELATRQRALATGFVGARPVSAAMRHAQFAVLDVARHLPLGRFRALPEKALRRIDLMRGLSAPRRKPR